MAGVDTRAIAAQVVKARAAMGSNFIRGGRGIALIQALKLEELNAGPTFVAELLILQSEDIPGQTDAKGAALHANPPGTTVAFIQQFRKFEQTAFGNVKAFLLALDDVAEDQVPEAALMEAFEAAVGKDNPLRGTRVAYETYQKKSRKNAIDLTLPKWIRVPGQTDEIVADTRKWLDQKAALSSTPPAV